jgi:hypothetical protein
MISLRAAILSDILSSLFFYCKTPVHSVPCSLPQVHTPSFTAISLNEVTTCHSILDLSMEDHACICANTFPVFGQFSQVECKAITVGRHNAIIPRVDVAHPLTKTFRVLQQHRNGNTSIKHLDKVQQKPISKHERLNLFACM